MNYAALKAELAKPDYVSLSDDEAATAISAATMQRARPIPAAEIKKLWGRWGVLGIAWVKAQNAALPEEIRAVCRATYDNLMGDLFADMDPRDPAAEQDMTRYLDALESAGVLTEAQRVATLALAAETVRLSVVLGWVGDIPPADVTAARAMEG